MGNVVGRPIAALVLSTDERAYLKRQVRGRRVARSLSERCRAILRCADGIPSKSVANELGIHEHTVGKWRRRFLKDRIEGLLDEARPGRPRTIDDDQIAAVIERTLRSRPEDSTHWSIRSMATASGYSHTTIRRIWTAFGLQPHRSQSFKLSSDPLFVDKVRDIVGLLFITAKSGAGAQCRREKPDTNPRPRTACLADDARHSGTPDPFLCPPRHNLPVCSPRRRLRICDR